MKELALESDKKELEKMVQEEEQRLCIFYFAVSCDPAYAKSQIAKSPDQKKSSRSFRFSLFVHSVLVPRTLRT